jgi:large subunit ribosomal protein L2
MGLKTYNPTSPGRRQLITTDRSELWKGKPVKALTEGLHSRAAATTPAASPPIIAAAVTSVLPHGRLQASQVRRAVGTVERLEYDPNRTAFIALVKYEDGELAYILAPQRLAAGDKVISSMQTVDVKPGNAMPLERMPVGTIVHNVEMKPGKGGQIARSAGTYAQYVGRDPAGRSCASTRASSAGSRHLPRDGRRGVEPGPRQHLDRQGRSQPLARQEAGQPRRDHEPGRPPARWW